MRNLAEANPNSNLNSNSNRNQIQVEYIDQLIYELILWPKIRPRFSAFICWCEWLSI